MNDERIAHEAVTREVIRDEIVSNLFAANAAAPDDVDASIELNPVFSSTEVDQAINNVAGTLNTVLGVLRSNGLLAEPS